MVLFTLVQMTKVYALGGQTGEKLGNLKHPAKFSLRLLLVQMAWLLRVK